MKERSLTWQILAAVLAAELLCAIALSGAALLHERFERYRAFDVMLRGRADSLLGAVQDAEDPGDNVMLDRTELALPVDDAYEVVDVSGRILGHSPQWDSSFEPPAKSGYSDQRIRGVSYRVLRTDGVRVIDREENGGIRRPVVLVYAAPTRHLWHSIFEAVRFYIATSLLLLALTAIALTWFLRRALFPLRDLAEQASKVSAQSWSFHPSPEVLRTRELKPLALSIAQLLQGLENSFAQQRRFTSDAAHELKTALAVIKSSLQLLQLRPRSNDEYQAGLKRPIADTERMEELVNRMLTLGRADEQRPCATVQSDLGGCLERAAEQLQPLANLQQVQVVVSAPRLLYVALSSEEVEILCSNLLSNAIQHSEAQSIVTAAAKPSGKGVELAITDHGDGIPEEALPHIFDRFFRADKSRTRQTGGSGLGLAICKAIVSNAGGAIHVSSAPGEGTSVTVAFPRVT